MRILKPCPACGKPSWRPLHAVVRHDAEIEDIEDLIEWMESVENDR